MPTMFVPPVCRVSPIEADLYSALSNILKEEGKVIKHPVRPSSISHCQRQIWYQYQNFKKPKSIPVMPEGVRKLMTFDRGHRTETQVAEWVAKIPGYKVVEFKEQLLIDEFPEFGFVLYGEFDRIIVDPNNRMVMMDVKSSAERTFLRIYESGIPNEGNYLQQQIYLHALKKIGITTGALYYENKNTQAFRILEFDYVEAHYAYCRERMVNLLSQCASDSAPGREYVIGDWQCDERYCDFHDYCYHHLHKETPPTLLPDSIPGLDQALSQKLTLDAEDQLVRFLQQYGEGNTFRYKNFILTLRPIKTKIKVDITHAQ